MYSNKHKMLYLTTAGLLSLTLAVAPARAEELNDADITSAIDSELWADNEVSANSIDVETQDGVVTFTGTAANILVKDRAEEIAEATKGVRAIVNLINVQPQDRRSDKELADAIEKAWLNDPAADSYEVTAKAKSGTVTLSGTVDSYAERSICETVAKGVKGVRAIDNRIDVEYEIRRPDHEILNEVEARLENDVRVDDYLVDVKVADGKVTLSGTVGSLREKNRANSDAWVAGVKSVKDDQLDIKWWARDDMRRKSTFVSRTDEEIEKAVKAAFLYDPRVFSFQPDVRVNNGTVTLSGIVDNVAAKRAAAEDARNTLGVWRVKNHLNVRAEVPDNETLKQRVADALLEDPYVNRFDIDISPGTGWVWLSGDVNTSFEKNHAERVVERVKGVVGVANLIEYTYEWSHAPDWEIRQDVKSQLYWSPFVDSDDINVSVDDGVVTLTGSVDSWSEHGDAEKNAFEGGAKDVKNRLTVDYPYHGPYGPTYYGSPYYYPPYGY